MVTFDGINKIIQVNNDVTQLEMGLVYSLWKLWIVESENNYNSRYLKAFTLVGGDPLIGGKSLGITYFLENGWRMRPAPQDHSLNVIGNVYTREGLSPFIQVEGNHTVSVIMTVSNLTDAEIMESEFKDNLDYRGSVYMDMTSEYEGVLHPIGTQLKPVNNLEDALEIAKRIGTRRIYVLGELILDRDLTNYTFIGDGNNNMIDLPKLNAYGGYPDRFETSFIEVDEYNEYLEIIGRKTVPMRVYLGYDFPGLENVPGIGTIPPITEYPAGNPLKTGPLPHSNYEVRPLMLSSFGCDALIDFNGYNVNGCTFKNFILTGFYDGFVNIEKCKLVNPLRFMGDIENSSLSGDAHIIDGDRCQATSLKVRYIDNKASIFDMDNVNLFSAISCVNLSGHYHLHNLHSPATEFIADFDSGEFIIDDSCEEGSVRIRGVNVYSDYASDSLYVENDGVVNAKHIAKAVWQQDYRALFEGKDYEKLPPEHKANMMVHMVTDKLAEKVWKYDIKNMIGSITEGMSEEDKEKLTNEMGYFLKDKINEISTLMYALL